MKQPSLQAESDAGRGEGCGSEMMGKMVVEEEGSRKRRQQRGFTSQHRNATVSWLDYRLEALEERPLAMLEAGTPCTDGFRDYCRPVVLAMNIGARKRPR